MSRGYSADDLEYLQDLAVQSTAEITGRDIGFIRSIVSYPQAPEYRVLNTIYTSLLMAHDRGQASE